MAKIFDAVKMTKPKTSVFDLSHERKFSANMAKLIPIMVQEVIPNDNFQVNTELMIRFAPLVAPVMHRINVYTHYFFVPNRLVWDNWEKFITGGRDGKDASVHPRITVNNTNKASFSEGSLSDYMGVPPMSGKSVFTGSFDISALPFRAYAEIYNRYYRDQNLEIEVAYSHGDTLTTGDEGRLLTLRDRCWEKDYFTSCLPWAQRGDEVELPIDSEITYKNPATFWKTESGAGSGAISAVGAGGELQDGNNKTGTVVNIESIDETLTVNNLRRTMALQRWLEKNARAGSRYVEHILAHFGVRLDDYRASQPVYLGGGKQPVVVSEVLSTVQKDPTQDYEGLPQGNMSGHAISVGNTNQFKYHFKEHGWVIGIMSVIPTSAYQEGIDKSLQRFDRYDYAYPLFANLGEQAVLKKELYYDPTDTNDALNNDTFGYQSRYAEYKYKNSTVHGDFRSTMAHWHLGRILDGTPTLNSTFVACQPDNRIFAVVEPLASTLWVQLYNNVKARRPLPYFGTPL